MPKNTDIDIPFGPNLTQQDIQDSSSSSNPTEKIPRINNKDFGFEEQQASSNNDLKTTKEMLDNFADAKSVSSDTNSDIDHSDSKEKSNNKVNVDFSETKPKTKPKKHNIAWGKWFLWVILGIVILAVLFGVWNRWFRYNDEESFISNWQVAGSSAIVTIDGKHIVLDKNANLEYSLDTAGKIVHYKLGNMEGSSHYRFSWDRNQVALIEQNDNNPLMSFFEDIGWLWDYSVCQINGIDLSPAYTKNNPDEIDTKDTGIEDIIRNGKKQTILLDRVSTKKATQ